MTDRFCGTPSLMDVPQHTGRQALRSEPPDTDRHSIKSRGQKQWFYVKIIALCPME